LHTCWDDQRLVAAQGLTLLAYLLSDGPSERFRSEWAAEPHLVRYLASYWWEDIEGVDCGAVVRHKAEAVLSLLERMREAEARRQKVQQNVWQLRFAPWGLPGKMCGKRLMAARAARGPAFRPVIPACSPTRAAIGLPAGHGGPAFRLGLLSLGL
jgi:ENTH domain